MEIKNRKGNLHSKEYKVAFLFVLAPTIGFVLFSLIPLIYSVYASFTDWNGLGRMNFIGLDNFVQMFNDPYFFQTLYNTFYLMIGIPIGLLLSFALASALSRGIKGTSIFRTIYYIPVISSLAAVSILWQWAYNGDFGLINQVLNIFGIEGPNWLQNTATVKPAIIIMTIWKGLGYSMLLYLAAIQSVPKTFYEAAELDGASSFHKFRFITWPMVKPVTFFLVVTNIIGGSQIFTEINIMTPTGGPRYGSATIVWYIWQKAFKNWQMGYASSMALVLAFIVFVVTALQFYINNKKSYQID
ncbi:sugar ABC transporter permease [Globicatella sp. PHS-GS-PNBC-21-1553]|uniref:carbohydrate ABC transporter permease n=1 Tax=Globicatella sp. PHS-GS-PNBC-21-1553 TaxID=2885764 RepID=UPI00298EF6C3|nr:sugar ABC transporter permease [Globicatella sp. PHS-GS-PNBC-21-1553]WPC09632.1 sugar ABC transporter permease [Globicatella sp. PHS-GS-PNBC-21-1553]